MTEPKTGTLSAPGAELQYDIRSAGPDSGPALLIIGSPMGAEGFVTLAGHFADRTVVTYDPRGAGRSPRTDGALETSPDEHADDLHRLISALDAGPVDIFASSGGAVNSLALVAEHPDDVRILVAHEPPLLALLPDADGAFAADHVHHQVEALLPLMADKLDPYWADFHADGGADFGDYLTKRGDEVAEALLSITDARAASSTHPTIVKAYQAVRGNASKHVTAALPQVGALVQKYA